jgi:hypothetical protein
VKLNGKWGYIDRNGKLAIPTQFDFAQSFSEGTAAVLAEGKYGYINKRGSWSIPPQFDEAGLFFRGSALARRGEQWLVLRRRATDGDLIMTNIPADQRVANELKPVFLYGKAGYSDELGDLLIKPLFEGAGIFADGLAPVKLGGKTGYIDKTGRMVIKPQFDTAGGFSEGVAPVSVNGQWGYIDRQGAMVITPRYNQARAFRRGRAPVKTFSEGLAPIKLSQGWGFIDQAGKVVIKAQFDGARPFSEGRAVVNIKTLSRSYFSYINSAGEFVSKAQLDAAEDFSEGLAVAELNGKVGFVDKAGATAIPFELESAEHFRNGQASALLHGRNVFIDKEGQVIGSKPPRLFFPEAAMATLIIEGGLGGYTSTTLRALRVNLTLESTPPQAKIYLVPRFAWEQNGDEAMMWNDAALKEHYVSAGPTNLNYESEEKQFYAVFILANGKRTSCRCDVTVLKQINKCVGQDFKDPK